MSCSAKLIEDWNQIFAFKIIETDLMNPTEAFLTNALINYLKMFGFDAASMINANSLENPTESRNFKIKLCLYIDHIYKVAKSSASFAFYDLKHPTSKKTVHLLSFLLNYLSYCNMFKETTVGETLKKIKIHDELQEKINKVNIDKEQIYIKATNIEKKIRERREEIPKAINKLNALLNQDENEKEKIAEMRTMLNEHRTNLDLLLDQERQLQNQIVTQDEARSLKTKLANLKFAINEEEKIESKVYILCKEQSEQIETRMRLKNMIENVKELYPIRLLEEYSKVVSECQTAKSEFERVNEEKGELIEEQKRADSELGALKGKVVCTEKDIKSLLVNIESKKKLIAKRSDDIKYLNDDLTRSEKKVAEERETTDYLVMKTKEMLNFNKPYFDKLTEEMS